MLGASRQSPSRPREVGRSVVRDVAQAVDGGAEGRDVGFRGEDAAVGPEAPRADLLDGERVSDDVVAFLGIGHLIPVGRRRRWLPRGGGGAREVRTSSGPAMKGPGR